MQHDNTFFPRRSYYKNYRVLSRPSKFISYLLVIIIIVLCSIVYLKCRDKIEIEKKDAVRFSLERFHHQSRPFYISTHNFNINFSDRALNSSIFRNQEFGIEVYLIALRNSVKIISILKNKYYIAAQKDCSQHIKSSLDYNQHSLEQNFPRILYEMKQIAHMLHDNATVGGSVDYFDLLWKDVDDVDDIDIRVPKKHFHPAFQRPLFHYINMYPYFVVYCTRKSKDKENWDAGRQYTIEVAKSVVKSKEWSANSGIDFISPASHPKTGPLNTHEMELKMFIRQTFLRTDFDLMGYSPKDIIVPYFVPSTVRADTAGESRLLLFFAGGDNPPGGLRSQFQDSFADLAMQSDFSDVYFSVAASASLSGAEYSQRMSRADFCLMLRGDTASSKRLFSAISHGCIPVIISDWIPLPFEALLDYSQFTLRFSESAFHNVEGLLTYLRIEVGPARREALRRNLHMARSLLLYQPAEAGGGGGAGSGGKVGTKAFSTLSLQQPPLPSPSSVEYFLLNPVTLTLIEAFIRRKKYCDDLSLSTISAMCSQLYDRLDFARQQLAQ
jgi:hypothetical protein